MQFNFFALNLTWTRIFGIDVEGTKYKGLESLTNVNAPALEGNLNWCGVYTMEVSLFQIYANISCY